MYSSEKALNAPESIPRSLFSTSTLRQMEHIDQSTIHNAWSEAMSVFFQPGPITDPKLKKKFNPKGTVDGYIDNFLFDGFMTIKVGASGQTFVRSKQAIAQDGLDGFLVQCLDDGEIHCEAGSLRSSNVSGGIHIIDMAREGTSYTSRFNSYSILLPRKTMEDMGLDLDKLHLQALPKENPVAHMFNRHVCDMHQKANSMTIAEARSLEVPTAALLKAALSGSADNRLEAAPAIKRGLLHEIRRYIDQNLLDPHLSPDSILQTFGLSRASLYRLAQPLGGIQRFIKTRRLNHAFQQLTGQHLMTISISNLAYDLGFGSEGTFRRAFKEAFGMTPKEARAQGLQAYVSYRANSAECGANHHHTQMPFGDMLHKRWVNDLFA